MSRPYLEEPWHDLVHIIDIIEVLREGIVDINGDHFPISLTLVNHGKHSQHLGDEDSYGTA